LVVFLLKTVTEALSYKIPQVPQTTTAGGPS